MREFIYREYSMLQTTENIKTGKIFIQSFPLKTAPYICILLLTIFSTCAFGQTIFKYRGGLAYAGLLNVYLSNEKLSIENSIKVFSSSKGSCFEIGINAETGKKCALLYLQETDLTSRNIVLSALQKVVENPCEVWLEIKKLNSATLQNKISSMEKEKYFYCEKNHTPIAIGLFEIKENSKFILIKTILLGKNK